MKLRTAFLGSLALLLFAGAAHSADKYMIDAVHSYVGFSVRHLVISNVKGNFSDFSGTITVDGADPGKSAVDVTIKAASIDTDNDGRDTHLKSADFFDVQKYPDITFQSTKVEKTDAGYTLYGKLTMHGKTNDVIIPFQFNGKIKDPQGAERIAFEGQTSLSRSAYDITWNKALETGGVVVGDEVKIDLQIEAVKM